LRGLVGHETPNALLVHGPEQLHGCLDEWVAEIVNDSADYHTTSTQAYDESTQDLTVSNIKGFNFHRQQRSLSDTEQVAPASEPQQFEASGSVRRRHHAVHDPTTDRCDWPRQLDRRTTNRGTALGLDDHTDDPRGSDDCRLRRWVLLRTDLEAAKHENAQSEERA
jgi:hypothetical protein